MLTSQDYNVLGAATQIPIILTGSVVSLLNLEMSYCSAEVSSLSYCFQVISFFVKFSTGGNLFARFTPLSILLFVQFTPMSIYSDIFAPRYQCQYILIPDTPTFPTDPHPQLVKHPPTKLEVFNVDSTSKYIVTSI